MNLRYRPIFSFAQLLPGHSSVTIICIHVIHCAGPNLNCEERSCDSKSATECNICFENEGDHVLLPCGHGGYCHTCAHQLLASRAIARTCPMCRAPLTSIAKVSLNAKIGEQACVLRAFAVSPIQTVQNTPSTLLPNLEQSHSSMEDSGPTANRTTPIGMCFVYRYADTSSISKRSVSVFF